MNLLSYQKAHCGSPVLQKPALPLYLQLTALIAKWHSWKMKQWCLHQGKVKYPETQASEISSSRLILCAEGILLSLISQIYPAPSLSLSFTDHWSGAEPRSIPSAGSNSRKNAIITARTYHTPVKHAWATATAQLWLNKLHCFSTGHPQACSFQMQPQSEGLWKARRNSLDPAEAVTCVLPLTQPAAAEKSLEIKD